MGGVKVKESEIQSKFNKWLRQHDYWFFHDERGTGRGKRHRAGWADNIIFNKPAMFIELKTETGVQSDDQIEFEEKCQEQGYAYYLARGFEQAKTIVIQHYNGSVK